MILCKKCNLPVGYASPLCTEGKLLGLFLSDHEWVETKEVEQIQLLEQKYNEINRDYVKLQQDYLQLLEKEQTCRKELNNTNRKRTRRIKFSRDTKEYIITVIVALILGAITIFFLSGCAPKTYNCVPIYYIDYANDRGVVQGRYIFLGKLIQKKFWLYDGFVISDGAPLNIIERNWRDKLECVNNEKLKPGIYSVSIPTTKGYILSYWAYSRRRSLGYALYHSKRRNGRYIG